MKYLNIEIGTKEIKVFSAYLKEGRIINRCEARSRIDAVYSGGNFSLDTEAIVMTAVEGLRNAGGCDVVTVTGITNACVVLDESDRLLFPCLASRDPSIENVDAGMIDQRKLFDQSGLVPDKKAVIYQLLAMKQEDEHLFSRAGTFLFLADYIRFRLTGVKASDYSLAQAAGLTLKEEKEWNGELFETLGMKNLFPAFFEYGTSLGPLQPEVVKEAGYDTTVLAIPCNSLAFAGDVLDCHMFITSYLDGRVGVVCDGPVLNDEVFNASGKNITMCDGRNVLLMPFDGYKLIERLKNQCQGGTTFDTLEETARDNKVFEYIDIRDERLMLGDVVEAVNAQVDEQGKEKVDSDVATGILYNSVARYVSGSVRLLDEINEAYSPEICVIGHGAKDYYLNSLVTMHSGKKIIASAGFFSSMLASLHLMILNKECSRADVLDIMRKTYGLATFSRA